MPNRPLPFSRRQVIRALLATSAFGVTAKFGTGCSNQTSTPTATTNSSGAKDVKIGFIYVGPKDDFGYNQAHAEGAAGIAKLPGVKIVEQASVPETNEVQEAMRNMIEVDKVNAIFPTSFGYFDPHILKIAKEFPEVQFFHCGGLYKEGVHPSNIGSYYGYIDEGQYIAGIVAAHASKSGKLGFVAAKPIPQVLRNINSYTLGAKSVNPKITTQLIFTGDWSLPVKEAEAANSMVDQGVDVITCHVDSPKVVIETAEKRGIFSTGYHTNQSALAPKGYLTGAEWDWTSIYTQYVKWLQAGKTLTDGGIPHLVRGGFKDGFLKISPFGPAVSEASKKQAEAVKEKFIQGTQIIYKGEIKDNTGKVVIPVGKEFPQQAIELESMNWLVQGVNGKV
jgi:simple sugar transport system substrate-binding protein